MSTNVAEQLWTRKEAMRAPAIVGAAGLSAAVLLHFYDPHSSGSYGYCPFLLLTGHPCPGCGGLRAVNDLTRGDFAAAVSSNALAVVLVAVLAVAFLRWIPRRWRGGRGQMITMGARTGVAVMILIFAFGVFRNTPWGSWLAP